MQMADGEEDEAGGDSARWGCSMWVNRLRCSLSCSSYVSIRRVMPELCRAERRRSAAPLLRGLALKSGHKLVPSLLLLLYSSSPSVCSFIPSFIYLFLPLSAAAHIPALPSHIPLLSDCISSLAVLLLSICLFAAPLSVLISVIRLRGISWD